jgi:hypothetical protein
MTVKAVADSITNNEGVIMEDQRVKCTKKKRKKSSYEKPQLKTVKLFADQVLGGCSDLSIGCSLSPANVTSG